MSRNNETFDELVNQTKSGRRTPRSLISLVKGRPEFIKETYKRTTFLDEYNCDIPERLYNIIHDRTSPVPCRFCGRKAIFGKSFTEGYSEICNDKKCRNKLQFVHGYEHNDIALKRDAQFKKKQAEITYVDDDVIKDLLKIERQYTLIDNPIIVDYLRNRFSDNSTDDLLEPIQRIFTGTFVWPKCACPDCNNYTLWNRRRDRLYTRHCSCECANRNPNTIKKKEITFLKNYGTYAYLTSDDYKKKMKEKYDIIDSTDLNYSKNRTIDKKDGSKNVYVGSSKEEEDVYGFFIDLGISIDRHHVDKIFEHNVDFYWRDECLYIEYQGSQYHNGKSFLGTDEDMKELERLNAKNDRLCINKPKGKYSISRQTENMVLNIYGQEQMLEEEKKQKIKESNF